MRSKAIMIDPKFFKSILQSGTRDTQKSGGSLLASQASMGPRQHHFNMPSLGLRQDVICTHGFGLSRLDESFYISSADGLPGLHDDHALDQIF